MTAYPHVPGAFLVAVAAAAVFAALSFARASAADRPAAPAGQDASKRAVERQLLAKAAANIEKHRKARATIRIQSPDGRPVGGARVEVRQLAHEFLFGCIIFDLVRAKEPYKPELFQQRFGELFNFAVFPFYWKGYEPRPGKPRQAETAKVARWCRDNGITTKGHPLVWTHPAGVPDWIRSRPPAETEKLLLGRITREVQQFAGLIDIWDVVNEPIHTRTWTNAKGRDYIHEPIEKTADYVDKTFRAAHKANPKANLILNEYYTIARPRDRKRFYQLAETLKRRGTPISGLGIQAHEPRRHWFPPQDVLATYDRLGSLGWPLHVTEFIPQSGGKAITGGWRTGKWNAAAQADFAEQFYRLSFGHPRVVSINWWGFTDRRIWRPGGGLLDREYQPKPVYTRLKKLIHEEWKTRLTATTDAKGTVALRGFLGRYSIRVTAPGRPARSFDASLRRDVKNAWVFTLAGK